MVTEGAASAGPDARLRVLSSSAERRASSGAAATGTPPSERDDAPFGRLLRDFRRRAGHSQQALADVSGLSVDAIAALERGRRRAPRAFTVRILAQALELDDAQTAALHAAASGAPAPRRAPARLRVPPGPLIGRDGEVVALRRLLEAGDSRCVTLVGPGGIGKTRLALEVGRQLDGPETQVAWLALEAVTAPGDVETVVLSALDVRAIGDDPLSAAIDSLGDRPVLLVLDNCEHLVDEVARIVASLLEGTTRLRVLATSRERLGIAGEATWPVLPLEVPDPDCTAEELADYPATDLLLRLIRQLDPTFTVTAAEVPEVVALCEHLDGLPLALELAAARTGMMTISEVTAALETGLEVLRTPTRTIAPRHQAITNTLGWSFDLLTSAEQLMLVRLAVFVDGCTRDAAVAVCTGGPIRRGEVLPLVENLIAKSLAIRRTHAGTSRIGLLDTVRRYALERRDEVDDDADIELRHATYVCELAETVGSALETTDGRRWLDAVDAELGNVRQAIGWAVATDQPELALRTAGGLWRWCYLRGHYAEGRAWLDDALAIGADCPPALQVKAMSGAAMLAFLQCEYESSRRAFEETLTAYRQLGDLAGEAWALQRLGAIAREQARYDDAESLHRASMAILELERGAEEARRDLGYLVFVLWLRCDLDEAAELGAQALDAVRSSGHGERLVWAMLNLAAVAIYRGDLSSAQGLLSESLTRADEIGYREGVAWSRNLFGVVARRTGDHLAAESLLRDSLALHRELGDQWRTASVLEELAACAAAADDAVRAAHLLGAADGIRSRIGAPVPQCERSDREATANTAREALGPAGLDSALLAGSAIPLDRLVSPVRQLRGPRPTRSRRSSVPT